MTTDQRKRRAVSTTAPFGFGVQEQYRAKKREFRSLQCDFNSNSHVSLKWDDNEKIVVAKEDQVGISSRHLGPFGPFSSAKLADVVVVPKEVFELGDLAEVLTSEDWQSLLTEKDKTFLAQFLPQGFEVDEVVKKLLGCENFHFGNPFLKWGSSLCSGNLHPDAVVQYEKSFKANKKAYYSELQKYHDNMIRNLQMLKERCASSKDPESEILKIVPRSKGHAEKNVLPDSNGFIPPKLEANATYESTSSIAEDKSYYSDNQKLSVIRDAEILRRNRNQELKKDKNEKWLSSPDGLKGLPRPKKAEKSLKANINSNDGTKYMSYVKISKKQHDELVMSMGQSSPVIQSKNLNRLLGNLNSYSVKPYVMFEEEEQKRIHEHWTNLVNKDLPAALQNWRRGQLERLQIMGFLCQELEDKLELLTENQNKKLLKPFGKGIADARDVEGYCQENKSASPGFISDSDKPAQCSPQNETSNSSLSLNIIQESDPSSLQNPSNVNEAFDSSSMEKHFPQNPLININKEFDPSMGNQSMQNPSNVSDALDSTSIEKQFSHNPLININKEFDPSSMGNQSLHNLSNVSEAVDSSSREKPFSQNPPINIKKEFDPSSMGNKSLREDFGSSSMENKSLTGNPPINIKKEFDPSFMGNQSLRTSPPIGNGDFGSSSTENKLLTGNPPLRDNQEFDHVDLNAENQVSSESSDTSSPPEHLVGQTSEFFLGVSHTKTLSLASGDKVVEMPRSSVNDMWSSMGFPESYGHSRPTTQFALPSEPTVRHPQLVPEQPSHLIALDRNLPGGITKDLLNSHTNHMPFINPCANRERTEPVLRSLIQRDNFHQEQKKTGSVFHPSNALLGTNQFPSHIHNQLHPSFAVDHKQMGQSGLFTNQNIHDSIYSDTIHSNRYSMQGQEHFSTINARNWSNAPMSIPIQSQLSSGGQLNQTWFANDNRAHSGWSAPEGTVFSTTSLVSGSGDQSLYSVLSQCNSLQHQPHYNPMGQSEQMMIPSTSYGQDVATVIPRSNPLPQMGSPFDYLSGSEATATLKNPVMDWMGLGHQPSALRDPAGKPFPKFWDQ